MLLTIFFFAFSRIYESFSFGETSIHMHYLFALPLVGGILLLRNEAHLYLPIETVTSLTVSTSQLMYSGSQARSALRSNSFSFRITVEVETAKFSAMSVIESFSISF